jgi:hypothetical protein
VRGPLEKGFYTTPLLCRLAKQKRIGRKKSRIIPDGEKWRFEDAEINFKKQIQLEKI